MSNSTKSQTDNTEWLDDLFAPLIDSNLTLTTTYWNEAKQAIQAKLKEQDIKSRIDELMSLPVKDFKPLIKRLAKLRSLL